MDDSLGPLMLGQSMVLIVSPDGTYRYAFAAGVTRSTIVAALRTIADQIEMEVATFDIRNVIGIDNPPEE